jgi:two-component system response regulator PilR (NtrC family)
MSYEEDWTLAIKLPYTKLGKHLECTLMGRILVVDDDLESRNLLCEVLQTNGYLEVEAVADGLAAREAVARDDDCPIIIADLHMPKESGLDLLRHLRNQSAKHEIILMSSYFSAAERKLARDLGAYALLDKPFRLSELLQVVSQLMEKNPISIST